MSFYMSAITYLLLLNTVQEFSRVVSPAMSWFVLCPVHDSRNIFQ